MMLGFVVWLQLFVLFKRGKARIKVFFTTFILGLALRKPLLSTASLWWWLLVTL